MAGSVLKGVKAQDGKLNVNAFARALETAKFKTPVGEAAMRADDHQVLLPIAVSKVTKDTAMRSEEHTSELQSLMRISYAVFCLKKKKKKTTTTNNQKRHKTI